MKKIICGFLFIATIIFIMLLTFQDAEGTVRLSEGLRHWLEQFGIFMSFHGIRSNAHLVLYFILGIAVSLYGRECDWKWWVIMLAGAGVGLIDESIKVLLPTREFDVVDLVKDWIGVAVGTGVVAISQNQKK